MMFVDTQKLLANARFQRSLSDCIGRLLVTDARKTNAASRRLFFFCVWYIIPYLWKRSKEYAILISCNISDEIHDCEVKYMLCRMRIDLSGGLCTKSDDGTRFVQR